MNDFIYHNPTKIVFGKDKILKIGEYSKPFGKKVMLVYGKSSIQSNGVYDKVVSSLKEAGLEIVEYPGVKTNPVLSHLRKGIEVARRENVDFILGVGGGSVIDESKGIAAGSMYNGDVWDFFIGKASPECALPIITLLTIPASGSETNCSLVITNEETAEKNIFFSHLLYPKISILDPTVTYTIPQIYSAYSAVGAISHLLEAYFTHEDEWAPIQDGYAENLIKSIMESTDRILENPEDYQARATMMWAASLACNDLGVAGLSNTSTPNRALEHPLSAVYDLPHGAGLSIVIPCWMSYSSRGSYKKFTRFAENVFGIKSVDDKLTAKKGIAALKKWFTKIGSPTSFPDANIQSPDIDMLSDKAFNIAKSWGIDNYSKKDLKEIYKLAL